eukprot:1237095-Amphidinium_carterae.1
MQTEVTVAWLDTIQGHLLRVEPQMYAHQEVLRAWFNTDTVSQEWFLNTSFAWAATYSVRHC